MQLNAVKQVKIGPKRQGDKKLPVEFISDHGKLDSDFKKSGIQIGFNFIAVPGSDAGCGGVQVRMRCQQCQHLEDIFEVTQLLTWRRMIG